MLQDGILLGKYLRLLKSTEIGVENLFFGSLYIEKYKIIGISFLVLRIISLFLIMILGY